MVTLERARARALREAEPLAPRRTPASQCRGLVLARAVEAPIDVPGVAVAAVDGFAVASHDLENASPLFPLRLEVDPAGSFPDRADAEEEATGAGTGDAGVAPLHGAFRLRAGAVIPPGADTVVPLGAARELAPVHVEFRAPTARGANVRLPGSEVTRGTTVLPANRELRATDLAILASLGLTEAWVHPAPRVGLAFLGEGRILPGRRLPPAHVYDTSHAMIGSLLEERGVEPNVLGELPLDPERLIRALRGHARSLDLLVVSGGVGPEEGNRLRDAIEWLEGETLFDRVRMEPGRTTLLARLGRCLVFGLPSDTTGVLAATRFLLLPAIDRLLGRKVAPLRLEDATLGAAVAPPAGAEEAGARPRKRAPGWRLLPARFVSSGRAPSAKRSHKTSGLVVSPVREVARERLLALAGLECFILLPDEPRALRAGDAVKIARLDHV